MQFYVHLNIVVRFSDYPFYTELNKVFGHAKHKVSKFYFFNNLFTYLQSALNVPQSHPRHFSTQHSTEDKPGKVRRKSSFMFSFEDLMTDSTCALKDTRYPTVTMRRQIDEDRFRSTTEVTFEPAKIVTLGRSVSVASRRGRCEQARRNRYISESQCSGSDLGSLFDLSTSKCKTPPPSRAPSFCSNYSGFRRRKESVISSVTSAGVAVDDVTKKRDDLLDEKEEDEFLDVELSSETSDHPVVSCWNNLSRLLGLSLCDDPRFAIVVISVMSMSVGELLF